MTAAGESSGWRGGLRTGRTLALATAGLGVSFGASATGVGWSAPVAVLSSVLVLSGAAQFAFLTATAGGAGPLTGVAAGVLMNLRFLPMAAASARSLHGGRLRRAFEGQTVVDGSWVPAQRADGSTDRELMLVATLVQWGAWIVGTVVGAVLVPSAESLHAFGLDVVFPCFFLLLLLETLKSRPDLGWVALAATVLAGAAVLVLPVGAALLASTAATALVLLRRRPRR